ncbi:holo-ACP synthase [Limnobacter litoralis]|uniref:Holo-[acyl-carrier-protein] synthase n=1 Tax=Limnobacter litoralis TaxID=481366 RepID=A0ABQ5YMT6_9BURK|nr:holo-ACP synthase [Limnobacter litoralis]GLR25913.1 holo-[acyl-carrier-protein] synthase [Limnobacter litoralis]
MLRGVGCDLVSVPRIAKALEQGGARFLARILTPLECAEYERRSAQSQKRGLSFLASRFAVKEAFSKALGTGVGGDFSFQDLSVLNDEKGAPRLVYSDRLNQWVQQHSAVVKISLSDEEDMAMGMVVIDTAINN